MDELSKETKYKFLLSTIESCLTILGSSYLLMIIINYLSNKYGIDFSLDYWDTVLFVILRNFIFRVTTKQYTNGRNN